MSTDQPIARKVQKVLELASEASKTELELSTSKFLMDRYGPLLDAKALIEVLHYPSQLALERSMQRGHIKLRTFHLAGRRGVFAHAKDVAGYIAASMVNPLENEDSDSQFDSPQSSRIEKGA